MLFRSIPGYFLLQSSVFQIVTLNNRLSNDGLGVSDGLMLQFGHPLLGSGGGYLELLSSDLNLFSNDQLPKVFPNGDRFDAGRRLGFHRDFGDITQGGDYWAVGAELDRVQAVPEPSAGALASAAALTCWLCALRRNTRKA